MFLALVDLLIKQADEEEYLAYRDQHVNPEMAATGAFVGSHLLRSAQPEDAEGYVPWLLMNAWKDLEVQRRFATSSSHAAQLDEMNRLVRIVTARSVEIVADASYLRSDRAPTRTYVIEYHRCRPGRGAEYLARWTDLRKKVDDFPECAGVSVSADLKSSDSFVVMYRWNSGNGAHAAAQADLEGGVADAVRDVVADGLGATTRYTEVSRWRA